MDKYEDLKDNIFHKYMSLEKLNRFLDYISVGKLYGAKYSELNDPFEGRYNKEHLTQDQQEQIKKKLQKTRICAFFLKEGNPHFPDNFLMWSYYANGHQGCCIEFSLTQGYNYQLWKIIPVEYNENMPVVNDDNDESIYKIVSTKTPDWRHENEVRAVKICNEIKYGKTPFYHIKIKAVYFGLNVPFKDFKIYGKIIKAFKPQVKVFRIIKNVGEVEYPTLDCKEYTSF